jgi:adenylate kinase
MKVSLLGPVGSGKGTQAHLVLGKLNYARISTGDLVRGQLEADTELGRELKGHSEWGEPVPDETIMELVQPHLQSAGAWILDACTRTIEQVRMLDEELKERSAGLDHVIVLEGPSNEELNERITSGSDTPWPPAGCTTSSTSFPQTRKKARTPGRSRSARTTPKRPSGGR